LLFGRGGAEGGAIGRSLLQAVHLCHSLVARFSELLQSGESWWLLETI